MGLESKSHALSSQAVPGWIITLVVISVMFMIFLCLFFRCLHDFFMIVVLLSYIGLSLRQTTN